MTRTDPRSGRTVNTVGISPAIRPVSAPAPPADVKNLIRESARTYNVPVELIDSVIEAESNYNSNAVSPKGARGLMQLMPETARRFGVQDSFDPRQNIEAGVRYLKLLKDTFGDDRLALAAYNAGEGAVQKYGGNVPPYPETIGYVDKVSRSYGSKRSTEAARQPPAENSGGAPKLPEYRKLIEYVDSNGRVNLTTQ